jgi:hypothetical protein
MILIGYIIELNSHRDLSIAQTAVQHKQTNLNSHMKRLDIRLKLNY